jgi:hypothetical protein
MRNKEGAWRSRPSGERSVLEIGIGSGLNLPSSRGVQRLASSSPTS